MLYIRTIIYSNVYMRPIGMISDIYSLSDREIAENIGKKIWRIRLYANITRAEMQDITGIHRKTIRDAEIGNNITMATLTGILRGLDSLHLLESLVSRDEEISPADMVNNKRKRRKRTQPGT